MNDNVDANSGDDHELSSGLPQTIGFGPELWTDQFSIDERILSHPLYSEPVIRTPQARGAYHACKERMRYGIDGFTVIGKPGMGRRGVVSVMRGYLHQEFPRLATFEHAISRFPSEKPSVNLSGLLVSAANEKTGGARTAQLDRLTSMLEERARTSNIPLCVLFLHNSEFANEALCNTLLDLRDSLRLRGLRIFFVHCALFDPFMNLVGELKKKLRPAELRSIFGTAYDVYAPETVEEYREILSEIDTAPFGSAGNATWIEALLPEAYRGGFRLASQAEPLHDAVRTFAGGRLSVRMFFEVVRTVVAQSTSQDRCGFEIPPEIWGDAVRLVTGVGYSYLLESGSQER